MLKEDPPHLSHEQMLLTLKFDLCDRCLGDYHCPGLNVNLLSSTFKHSPFTVSDRWMISVTVAWDTICQKEQFKYIKEQQQQSMYKVVLIWAAPKNTYCTD